MAKGKRWAKFEADGWVERWWDSGLTSDQFVLAEGLPISARSLRAHATRRSGEVLAEWKAQRAAASKLPDQVANLKAAQVIGAPDRVVSGTASSPGAPPVGGQVATGAAAPQPLRDAFDFSNVSGQVASRGALTTWLPAPGQMASPSVPVVPLPVITPDREAIDVTATALLPDGSSSQGAKPDHLAGEGGAERRAPTVPFDFDARADQVVSKEPSPAPTQQVLVDFWDLSAR